MNSSRRALPALLLAAAVLAGVFQGAVGAGGSDAATAVLRVDGMTCGSCAAGIARALNDLAGVEEASISFEESKAVIRFDPAVISVDAVMDSIKEIGYEVSAFPEGSSGDAAISEAAACNAGEAPPAVATAGEALTDETLTDEEISRVVEFVVGQLTGQDDGAVGPISRESIAAATGVNVPGSEAGRVQGAIIEVLEEEHPAILAKLSSGSRCSDYGACSLHGDLSGASGDTLVMYEREKGEEGKLYGDFPLPEFEATDLSGAVVRSSDLRGQPTVLTLLAGHCNHSHDSLPILEEALDTWGSEGLRVVAVLVNSGSAESVSSWISRLEPRYEVWVHDDASLGDLLRAHLVPSYLFVNAEGQVTEKLVGFKDGGIVREKLAGLMAPPGSIDLKTMESAAGAR